MNRRLFRPAERKIMKNAAVPAERKKHPVDGRLAGLLPEAERIRRVVVEDRRLSRLQRILFAHIIRIRIGRHVIRPHMDPHNIPARGIDKPDLPNRIRRRFRSDHPEIRIRIGV